MNNFNKKNILIIVLIILIIIAIVIVSRNKIINDNHSFDGEEVVIKSTLSNPIQKDGFEAKELKVDYINNEIMVYIKLQNNTNEVVDGYYVKIELLDEQDNYITLLAHNSKDKISPNQIVSFICASSLPDDANKITKARIVDIQKNSNFDFLNQDIQLNK